MTPDMPTDMRHWTPAQHIEAACDLLQTQTANTGGGYVITPVPLTQAQTHVAIAQAKMTGRLQA